MPRKKKSATPEIVEEEDDRYFLKPDAVSEHLYCSICQEIFFEPQRAPCGHSYCKRCILPWLKQSNTCPEDRKSLYSKDLHHDFILENIIGDQMVACPFRRKGCEFVGQLQLLKSHKKKCEFNPANLPKFLKNDKAEPLASAAIGNVAPVTGASGFESGEHVPTPGKPSLKMRLFCAGEKQKKLLCSVFEKENTPGSSQPKQKATQSSQRTSRAKRQRVDVNYDLSTSSFDNSEDVIDLS